MGRPKGSKNKTVKFTTKSDVFPEVPVNQAPKPEEWKPKPDMGAIKPPTPAEKICAECGGRGDSHYGGPNGWCNDPGCKC